MKIKRFIHICKKDEDAIFKNIDIAGIDLLVLKKIFIPADDDPNLYRPYKLNESQYNKLVKVEKQLGMYQFSMFEFYMEASASYL